MKLVGTLAVKGWAVGGKWAGSETAQAPPSCTKCNSSPINGQCTNHCVAVQWSVDLRFQCGHKGLIPLEQYGKQLQLFYETFWIVYQGSYYKIGRVAAPCNGA